MGRRLMQARVLRAADYQRMRWKNGGGWTTELAASRTNGDTFDWRDHAPQHLSGHAYDSFHGMLDMAA